MWDEVKPKKQSDLDTKLREIWCEQEGCTLGSVIDDKGIAQIKQATGNYFYERFVAEKDIVVMRGEDFGIDEALEAVKRASGL